MSVYSRFVMDESKASSDSEDIREERVFVIGNRKESMDPLGSTVGWW
jgi:c-di-AMP phosphodiesterase-like protein